MRPTHLRLALALALPAHAAPAQTYVVDGSGGVGSHYRDLATAVNAVPSGAVLRVRPGTYGGFSFANKSLSIIGDGSFARITGQILIGPLRAHDRVLLAHMGYDIPYVPELRVHDAQGQVVLQGLGSTAFGTRSGARPRIEFERCANLQVFGCVLEGRAIFRDCRAQLSHSYVVGMNSPIGHSYPHAAHPGIHQIGGSLHLVACTVTGGRGLFMPSCGPLVDVLGTPGAEAMRVELGGEAMLFRCTLTGGNGSMAVSPCSPAQNGGDGLFVTHASATVLGSTLRGGSAGGASAMNGKPLNAGSGATTLSDDTLQTTVANLEGEVRPGQNVSLTITTKPMSAAILLLGVETTQLPLAPIALGKLYCVPLITLGQFVVPAGGKLSLPLVIPQNWVRDVPIYAQFLTLQTGPQLLWASNPVMLMAKS